LPISPLQQAQEENIVASQFIATGAICIYHHQLLHYKITSTYMSSSYFVSKSDDDAFLNYKIINMIIERKTMLNNIVKSTDIEVITIEEKQQKDQVVSKYQLKKVKKEFNIIPITRNPYPERQSVREKINFFNNWLISNRKSD
jgi:hypothetical protein